MNPKTLLEAHGILPKKSLGQNFLHDPHTLDKIVQSAQLPPHAQVLEIGPGAGALTTRLATAAERVVAVEVDTRLEPVLRAVLAPHPNVELLFADILSVDVVQLFQPQPYSVVANLPYYITSAILKHLLESAQRPERLILTVQTEVAERLMAQPPDMSILSVSVQFFGQPRLVTRLKAGAFWPRPDVDSAVVRIDTYPTPPFPVPAVETFFRVVKAGFSQKRKQIKNSLSSALALESDIIQAILAEAQIEPNRRAETLHLAEWGALAQAYAAQQSTK